MQVQHEYSPIIPARVEKLNCTQEAGSAWERAAVNIGCMNPARSRPAGGPRAIAGWMLLLILLLLEWLSGRTHVHAAVVVTPRITLVVFADRPLPDQEWADLSASLHRGFTSLAEESHFAAADFEVVHGDGLAAGAQFDAVISVYLHGECRLAIQPGAHTAAGALGWVLRDHGQVRPFIHVDCERIGAMLGQRAFGVTQDARDLMMAVAVSRVVLHEWLHIATQNPAHTRDGIEKSRYTVQDLLPDYGRALAPASHGK